MDTCVCVRAATVVRVYLHDNGFEVFGINCLMLK
jgi:hypothetical protein